jgi:hypothetical protein
LFWLADPQWYWKTDFVKELRYDAIALHVEHGSKIPTTLSAMHLYPINGKPIGSRKRTRRGVIVRLFGLRLSSEWIRTGEARRRHPVGKRVLECFAPLLGGGAYVNFMMARNA